MITKQTETSSDSTAPAEQVKCLTVYLTLKGKKEKKNDSKLIITYLAVFIYVKEREREREYDINFSQRKASTSRLPMGRREVMVTEVIKARGLINRVVNICDLVSV